MTNRKQNFLCIFSFTVFIVNEYFTTVTKLRICAHHLLLTIILGILKCVTLYQVTIIPLYLYSEIRELKIFITSHFVTWLFSELYLYKLSLDFDRHWGKVICWSTILSIYSFVTPLSVSLHNLLDFYNLFCLCCIVMSRRSITH
jgi:hypothetical protein